MGLFDLSKHAKYNKADFPINATLGIKDITKRNKRLNSLRSKYGNDIVDSVIERYELRKELKDFLRKNNYPNVNVPEGIAEFVKHYVINPKQVINETPKFYALFENILDQNIQLKRALQDARKQYKEFSWV